MSSRAQLKPRVDSLMPRGQAAPTMVRTKSLLLVATLSTSLVGCIRAPDAATTEPSKGEAKRPADAAALLARYTEAMGGEPVLRGLPQRTVEARVIFRADETCPADDPTCMPEEREGQFVLYATGDGRLFRRMVVADRVSERGFDGKTGWNLDDGEFLEIEGDDASLASKEDALLHWYLDIEAREITPELVEEPLDRGHDDQERTLDGLTWQAAHGKLPARTLWFDRDTGLLREEVERISDDHKIVIIYDGYKAVDGAMVAHEIRQLEFRGDTRKEIDIVVLSVHHRDLREGLFDIPELPPLEPEADPFLSMLEDARAGANAAPKELEAQMTYARVAFAVAHFDEAESAAAAALKVDRREPEAMWILARSLLMRGDLKGAKRWLDKAAKVGLKPQEYAKHIAWIASHLRDWAKVGEALRVAGLVDLLEPYESVPGKALVSRFEGRKCSTDVAMSKSELVGAPVVEAEIDGKSVRLMLDTGTRDLILAKPIAQELLITRDADSPIGASGGPPFPHGYVEELKLGGLSVSNVTAAIVPASALDKSAGGVDGVLGVRPLLDHQVVFDVGGDSLQIYNGSSRCKRDRKANQVGVSAPLTIHETHFVYLLGKLNGAEGLFLLNTGMRGADVAASSGAYRRAGIRPPAIVAGEVGLAKVRSFEVAEGREIGSLGAAFGAFEGEASSDNFRLDGMVGMGALGPGRIVLDFPARTVFFPPAPDLPATPISEAKSPEPAPKK